MQWGQIKTLFILSFLLLDIYLLVLVVQKQDDIGTLDSSAIEEEQRFLEVENISIPEDLPNTVPNESLMAIEPKTFNKEEIEEITSRENQEIIVVGDRYINSLLEEPFAIPENATSDDIAQLLTSAVYLGNEYTFEYWDMERNILVFFQKKNERPIYYNQNGMLLVYLNDANEVVGYTQTVLGDLEVINEEEVLEKPLSAIKELYNNNLLYTNDTVTEVKLGYHNFFPLESGRQVLVPTWKITINDDRTRLVDGFERKVIPENHDFLDNALNTIVDNTILIRDNEEFKQNMLDLLSSKLEQSE
ncbi:two-component system regulatory protein YycI [Ornithinibacillus sp. 179-J 7C1 HS]|uniref:two-component system regulatory protein YycI n=1 Tax=Ornithinibacillus sp. 179-J 7C1 HS TaxID=3142384 RepID=UPI0039A01299